jgi:hypothetical protein
MHTRLPLPLVPLLLLATACGDDGRAESASASVTNITALTPGFGTDDIPTTAGPDATGTAGLTGSQSEGSNSDTQGSSGQVTATTTGDSNSSQACACTPGELGGCEGDLQLVCAPDCQSFEATPCSGGQLCSDGACPPQLCSPGQIVCDTDTSTKTCNAGGDAYDPPVPCDAGETCFDGSCLSLCELAEATPSSVGCSFFAQRMDNYSNYADDSLIVGNVSKIAAASVQLYFTPDGSNVEAPQGGPVNVAPGMTTTFPLSNPPFNKASGLRKGGSYRVQASIPVVAYQHSPIGAQATNDASMLLPEHALKQDYVVASYVDGLGFLPSYFNVLAIADNTTVTWTPPQSTLGGNGVPDVAGGQTGQVLMNRFDTMEVRAPDGGDVSGTIISADKPIWVVGAVNCVNVPAGVTFCDHIEEQMLPLDYWGKKYVGAHSPTRGSEKHYWRVYGGEDGTVVTTTPPQPGTPINLNKGQWVELVIANNTSFLFESDKPFMPVQYLEGQDGGAGTGDPAMYQMIPVEQFLDSYAFVTGTGYSQHYAQIIRTKGGPDVKVDGVVVAGYYAVGDYEVSDHPISEGGHLAESDAPFGILNIGYTGVTSYAYPGGLKLAVINPQ